MILDLSFQRNLVVQVAHTFKQHVIQRSFGYGIGYVASSLVHVADGDGRKGNITQWRGCRVQAYDNRVLTPLVPQIRDEVGREDSHDGEGDKEVNPLGVVEGGISDIFQTVYGRIEQVVLNVVVGLGFELFPPFTFQELHDQTAATSGHTVTGTVVPKNGRPPVYMASGVQILDRSFGITGINQTPSTDSHVNWLWKFNFFYSRHSTVNFITQLHPLTLLHYD